MNSTIEIFYPATANDWRNWLKKNGKKSQTVWVVFYKKSSDKPTITWSDAVDQALCFGWVDSKKVSVNDEQFHIFFSQRKPISTWSKINKEKIERLTKDGLMNKAGLDIIEEAKRNGSWTILDEVEEFIVPKDLEIALGKNLFAKDFFEGLSKSVKKGMLQWLVLAKRAETRQKRIDEIVELAGRREKPKQF